MNVKGINQITYYIDCSDGDTLIQFKYHKITNTFKEELSIASHEIKTQICSSHGEQYGKNIQVALLVNT